MASVQNDAIVTKTLADYAYQRIRRDIVSGRLAPGVKLRLEALGKQYEVSMTPLREALARLVGDSLATTEGQRGFWVASLSSEELEDITQVRTLIETEALQRSIVRGGPQWESNVRAAFDALTAVEKKLPAGNAVLEWEEANRHFHEALVSACDSPWLTKLQRALYEQAERYRRLSLAASTPERSVHDEHEAIFNASMQRQPLQACRLTETHLRRTADVAKEALRDAVNRKA